MKTMNCPVTKFIDSKMQRFDPLWQAQNGVGGLRSRYYDKTGVAKYREWRGLHDTMVDYRAWLKNVMSMAAMVASAPIPCLKGFWEYRWMGSYLGTFMFIDRLFEGYRGPELVIAHMNMHAIVQSLTKKIALVLSHDLRIGGKDSDKIIPVDEVMPPLFLTGFKDLIPIPLQTLPEFIICDVDQQLEPYYIDVAESFGLPADICSRCAAETLSLIHISVRTPGRPENVYQASSPPLTFSAYSPAGDDGTASVTTSGATATEVCAPIQPEYSSTYCSGFSCPYMRLVSPTCTDNVFLSTTACAETAPKV